MNTSNLVKALAVIFLLAPTFVVGFAYPLTLLSMGSIYLAHRWLDERKVELHDDALLPLKLLELKVAELDTKVSRLNMSQTLKR